MAFTMTFQKPDVTALNETHKVRIVTYGTGGSISNAELWIVAPDGNASNCISSFRDVSSYLAFTFISMFDMDYTFRQKGLYTFMLWDKTSGDVLIESTYVAEWASRIDIPVSELKRQRTDIERISSKINRG